MANNDRKYSLDTKIAVLCGGLSSEREVSLRSGKNVFEACRKLKNISFSGSTEQWILISFGEGWCSDIPADKVVCSDGEAALE